MPQQLFCPLCGKHLKYKRIGFKFKIRCKDCDKTFFIIQRKGAGRMKSGTLSRYYKFEKKRKVK